jgi:plasmid stability protein
MATLHIRSFPENLYRRLGKLAQEERRSLSAEVVVLLEQVLETSPVSQSKVLSALDRWRFRSSRKKAPSSTDLLREERYA